MKAGRYVYVGTLTLALTVAFGLWKPLSGAADNNSDSFNSSTPSFSVDPAWPQPLPSTIDANGVAHKWVTGEVAGTCVDANNNVYTFNRGWQVGVTSNGVLQGAESGAIDGEDASGSAIPSPPIIGYNSAGKVIAGFGNPALLQPPSPSYGGAAYLPQGAHGCFVDYEGNIWVAGNGDGVVQKYAHNGGGGIFLMQIGQKGVCDGPATNSAISGASVFPTCGEAHDNNSSQTLLNEPADIAVDPEVGPVSGTRGDVYIADGYGNHRVVVFDRNGKFLLQFGSNCGMVSPTCPNGTFGATGGGHPHCVNLGNDGLVYTCDRPNSRIQVFDKKGNWVRTIPIEPAPNATASNKAAILANGTRACDMDFWPNIDYLADQSPTSQRLIIDVDLGNDNTWVLDKESGTMLGALGRCGLGPCPGHIAGEFAFGHTTASDSEGNVYVAETITGRRIQKFTRTGGAFK
jgi:hypothetical protein